MIPFDYLDFLPEEELLRIADQDQCEVLAVVDYPVRHKIYPAQDGSFRDTPYAHSRQGAVVECPFQNDSGVFQLPVGDGLLYEVECVRAVQLESGAWRWRASLKRFTRV